MYSIEKEFKANRMSLRSHLGSALATFAVFAAIASTNLQIGKLEPTETKERPVYYLAPPRELVEARSSSRKAPNTIDTFAADSVLDASNDKIVMEPIDISIDPEVRSGFSLDLEMQRTFEAAAPEMAEFDRFTIYERSEVDEEPVIRSSRQPDVPQKLRGETVKVIVFYYVTEKGRTDNQSVLSSTSDNPVYGELAVDAIKDWRFRPARKNRKAVPCWIQQTIIFNEGPTSPFSL